MRLETVKASWYEVILPQTTELLVSPELSALYTGTNNADRRKRNVFYDVSMGGKMLALALEQ